jgi:hypothetical protein
VPPAQWVVGFFKVVKWQRPDIMTCFRVIFWELEYRGAYSVFFTVWMVLGSNCSGDKNFSAPK